MNKKLKLIAALKTWLIIYPSITLFLFLFGKQLSPLPLYQRTFILTITLVPWMLFIGMPALEAIFRRVAVKKINSCQ
jgi:hypothetical protein